MDNKKPRCPCAICTWAHATRQKSASGNIGTGPWPDSQDTGDPPPTPVPATQPMQSGLDAWLPGGRFDGWGIMREPAKVTGPMVCKKCKTTNEYAEPNQKDGTYICFECR